MPWGAFSVSPSPRLRDSRSVCCHTRFCVGHGRRLEQWVLPHGVPSVQRGWKLGLTPGTLCILFNAGKGRETRAIEYPQPAQRISYHPYSAPLHRIKTDDMLPVSVHSVHSVRCGRGSRTRAEAHAGLLAVPMPRCCVQGAHMLSMSTVARGLPAWAAGASSAALPLQHPINRSAAQHPIDRSAAQQAVGSFPTPLEACCGRSAPAQSKLRH